MKDWDGNPVNVAIQEDAQQVGSKEGHTTHADADADADADARPHTRTCARTRSLTHYHSHITMPTRPVSLLLQFLLRFFDLMEQQVPAFKQAFGGKQHAQMIHPDATGQFK